MHFIAITTSWDFPPLESIHSAIDCFGLQRWGRAETPTAKRELFKTFILIDFLYTKMFPTFGFTCKDPGFYIRGKFRVVSSLRVFFQSSEFDATLKSALKMSH